MRGVFDEFFSQTRRTANKQDAGVVFYVKSLMRSNAVCVKMHKHKLGGTALLFMRPDMFDISGLFYLFKNF